MKRLCLSLICLAGTIPSRLSAQEPATDPLPLCQQFRVLSGLPWEEPGADRKTVLERIFREPNVLVRREVLKEYLDKVLPVAEFPAAFDECIALEQADFPDAVGQFVMRAWAERDPAAAITRCQSLFDLIIEGAPLGFDGWSKPIQVHDLDKARASTFWFGDRGIVHACWKGLAAADLTPERRIELEKIYGREYFRRFQEQPPGDIEEPTAIWARRYWYTWDKPPTIASDQALRADFFRIMSARPDEIAGSINWPRKPWEDFTLPRAMIRWMDGDPQNAPEIVGQLLDAYDPHCFYRGGSGALKIIPTEFLVEWAILDPAGFLAGASRAGKDWRVPAVQISLLPGPNREAINRFRQMLDEPSERLDARQLWIALNPDSALTNQFRYPDESNLDKALDELLRTCPAANYWRRAIGPFTRVGHLGWENEASGVTTVWGPIDFSAMVTKYGMPWCLSGNDNDIPQDRLAGMLANREALENSSGLRNTLSCLRTWAVLRPAEMRAWIDHGAFGSNLRQALVWLMENARGGFPAPPVPQVP